MNHKRLLLQILTPVLVMLILVACGTTQPPPAATHSPPTLTSTPTRTAITPTPIKPTATRTTTPPTGTPTPGPSENASSAPSDDPMRILFIGNSLTFYNDLPGMFADLARSGGHQVEFEMAAPGGWSLSHHAASEATLEKMERQRWDVVVLQERSDIPAIVDQREEQMYPAIRLLESRIRAGGAQTVLFVAWGRRDGLPEAGLGDYAAMQGQIQAGYIEIAKELQTLAAPVGLAWQRAMTQNQDLDLWAYDGIHPNEMGTYLAACVFYAVIFQQSPEGLAYWARVPVEKVEFLQTVAAETVLEGPERWHLP